MSTCFPGRPMLRKLEVARGGGPYIPSPHSCRCCFVWEDAQESVFTLLPSSAGGLLPPPLQLTRTSFLSQESDAGPWAHHVSPTPASFKCRHQTLMWVSSPRRDTHGVKQARAWLRGCSLLSCSGDSPSRFPAAHFLQKPLPAIAQEPV